MPEQISLIDKWNQEMALIQEKTGIRGIYVIIGLIISVFFVYKNIFDSVITNLVGTLYPVFWTIKSIDNDQTEEQKYWLTYWAVFSFFILIDMFSPIIVKIIPFYFVLKIIFLIWMFLPGTYGCKLFYNVVVKEILKKFEKELDGVFENMQNFANRDDDNFRRYKSRIINLNNINRAALEVPNNQENEEKKELFKIKEEIVKEEEIKKEDVVKKEEDEEDKKEIEIKKEEEIKKGEEDKKEEKNEDKNEEKEKKD